jgi:hypothetical protein
MFTVRVETMHQRPTEISTDDCLMFVGINSEFGYFTERALRILVEEERGAFSKRRQG